MRQFFGGFVFLIAAVLSTWSEAASAVFGWPSLALLRQCNGLVNPVGIAHAGDGSGRTFIVEQPGRIGIIRADAMAPPPFLDISDRVLFGGERGLLGIAFPPGFSTSGRFYVNYTRKPDGATVIARYHVTSNPDIADPLSEEQVLIISQPFPNHNGGQLAFGPDGYLYIGMGDGGSGGDPLGNAQNHGSLLGKMLRIDVESGIIPYALPSTNPFVRSSGYRPEIWALGLRNPWRFSFDRATGDLYIGDVGQNLYEEIDFQPASGTGGENYGWNIMEASHCYQSTTCDTAGLVLPVAEYDHTTGDCAVIGGMVSRGKKYPGLDGIYLYGDYCSGRLRGLRNDGGSYSNTILFSSPYSITALGEDEAGSIYLADYVTGTIYRVAEAFRGMPVPAGKDVFTFAASDSPVVDPDPAKLNPFGFGTVADGGETLQFQVALARFTGLVDIYIAYSVSSDPTNIFLMRPDLTFRAFTLNDAETVLSGRAVSGIEPWIKNVTGPIDLNPITIGAASLSSGRYTVYMLITPAGSLGSYYLASASFIIP